MKPTKYGRYVLMVTAINLIAVLLLANVVLVSSGSAAAQPVGWSDGSFMMWRIDIILSALVALLMIVILVQMVRSRELWDERTGRERDYDNFPSLGRKA